MLAAAAVAASSLSIVTNANQPRRFHPPTDTPDSVAPAAPVTDATVAANCVDAETGLA